MFQVVTSQRNKLENNYPVGKDVNLKIFQSLHEFNNCWDAILKSDISETCSHLLLKYLVLYGPIELILKYSPIIHACKNN